jgi:ABC-type lipoprotein release transport system permease subunit
MTAVLRHGLARLRRDRARTLLTAGGVAAASAMIGAAATIVFALATAFDRTAATAQMPDVTARFAEQPLAAVLPRVRELANIRAASYRFEANGVGIQRGRNFADGVVEGVRGNGPRGYALTAGRDISGDGEIVVERGLARSWHLRVGQRLSLDGPSATIAARIVGVAVTPGDIAYPLFRSPRLYASLNDSRRLVGAGSDVDEVLIWLHDRSQVDVTLAQARAASYGLSDLRFVTRSGYAHLIGRAGGVVIALLVSFSLIALAAAGVMLAASAAGEIQRRREAIGILRALGASPRTVAGAYAFEAALVATPAAGAGLLLGWAVVAGPTSRLLDILNELMPPAAPMLGLLAGCWLTIVGLVAAATWIPAWRSASEPAVASLRGGDVAGAPRRVPLPALAGLGARLALARPFRMAMLVTVLAASTAVVLLILAIADTLHGLERNAQTLGTRYQLTVPSSEASVDDVRNVPGVSTAALRFETEAADSFNLGESFRVIAFSGDLAQYEAPPLVEGRRVRSSDEVNVGRGLAQALDLHLGTTLAVQLPIDREVRFHVVGIVDALRDEGLVAYVQAPRLVAAMPSLSSVVAVKLRSPADLDHVRNVLLSRGATAEKTGGISQDSGVGSIGRSSFLNVLAALLRSVALLDGLVCVYALAQMLALIARERRRAVAVVRAVGASRVQVFAVFAGAAALVAALAAPLGVGAERLVLGPVVGRLSVSYVTLPLAAGRQTISLVLLGLAVATALAAAWATRSATADAIVGALREE